MFVEASTLREKLHSLIDNSSEEKLLEISSAFEDGYSDEFKASLNEEYAGYLNIGK